MSGNRVRTSNRMGIVQREACRTRFNGLGHRLDWLAVLHSRRACRTPRLTPRLPRPALRRRRGGFSRLRPVRRLRPRATSPRDRQPLALAPAGPAPAAAASQVRSFGAVLLDQHAHLVRRLGADAQPILDPLAVEHRPGVGVAAPSDRRCRALPTRGRRAAPDVHGADAKERAMLAAHLLHANSY